MGLLFARRICIGLISYCFITDTVHESSKALSINEISLSKWLERAILKVEHTDCLLVDAFLQVR